MCAAASCVATSSFSSRESTSPIAEPEHRVLDRIDAHQLGGRRLPLHHQAPSCCPRVAPPAVARVHRIARCESFSPRHTTLRSLSAWSRNAPVSGALSQADRRRPAEGGIEVV
jgi:hypothetical protein